GREDDRGLALQRQEHVRIPVDDREAAHVCHSALEAGVLRAADEGGVEAVARERLADVSVAAGHLVHDASNPFTSAQIAAFSGVGTPSSPPVRTMPPLR